MDQQVYFSSELNC